MNISAETSVEYISEEYDSSSSEPFDFRIKEPLRPEAGHFTGSAG